MIYLRIALQEIKH